MMIKINSWTGNALSCRVVFLGALPSYYHYPGDYNPLVIIFYFCFVHLSPALAQTFFIDVSYPDVSQEKY
jgi:hypothetical protein